MIFFSYGKAQKSLPLFVNDSEIEVDKFCFLGIMFELNETFQAAIKHNTEKARKELWKLLTETFDHERN